MKYFLFLITTMFICSCSTNKTAAQSQSEQQKTVNIENQIREIKKESEPIFLPPPPKPPKPPKEAKNSNISIHKRWNDILSSNVSDLGKVNYLGIKSSTEFDVYIDILLHNSPEDSWSHKRKLAFWINAYNALTIDLILRNYPLESIKDIKDPWDQKLWEFDDIYLSLNDIEHNILRKMNEPRIHFAIVCASESCPKLQNTAFTAKNLEEQLTKATQEFLADTSKNKISENEIKLSKIFRWFKKDFEQDGSLIDFLNKYTAIEISDKAKKSFKDYSWDLND